MVFLKFSILILILLLICYYTTIIYRITGSDFDKSKPPLLKSLIPFYSWITNKI